MASSHPSNCWDVPTFHFNPPNQSEDWRTFYTRVLDYLDSLDIDTDQADDCHKGWKQLKLMFKSNDIQALQTLIGNGIIMAESMKTPQAALDAIGTAIKSEGHFRTHWDELLSNVRQLPGEGTHVLSQYICNLITECRFPHDKTQDLLKIMLLQHTVQYHEVQGLNLPPGPAHVPVPSLPL